MRRDTGDVVVRICRGRVAPLKASRAMSNALSSSGIELDSSLDEGSIEADASGLASDEKQAACLQCTARRSKQVWQQLPELAGSETALLIQYPV